MPVGTFSNRNVPSAADMTRQTQLVDLHGGIRNRIAREGIEQPAGQRDGGLG